MNRKYCAVPKCFNSNVKTPEIVFFSIPKNPTIRKKWMTAIRRQDSIAPKTIAFCCEDHFDMEKDMDNYIKHNLVGERLRLKKDIVPHKFACQNRLVEKTECPVIAKLKTKLLTEMEDLTENVASTSHDFDIAITVKVENIDIKPLDDTAKDMKTEGVIVHDFPQPSKFPEKFKAWVTLVGGSLETLREDEIYRKKKMCHKHFTAKDFNRNNRLNVMVAIPSLHLPKNVGDAADDSVLPDNADPPDDAVLPDNADPPDDAVIPDSAYDDIDDEDTRETTEEQLFSWQRNSEIDCDEFETNLDNSMKIENKNKAETNWHTVDTQYENTIEFPNSEEIKAKTDNQASSPKEESDVHEGYKCDTCKGPIRRFRYSCVECANYDLCGACEARAVHPQHYLLRVPRPRPHDEIQIIMDTIRRFLTADPKSLRAEANFVNTLMDEMKSEAMSETGSDPVPDEPDYPLHSDDSVDEADDCEMEESNVSLTPATQDGEVTCSAHVDHLEENTLQDWEFPHEIYETHEIKHDVNIANVQRPEGGVIYEINQSLPTSLGNVSHKLFVSCLNTDSMNNDLHIEQVPEQTVNTTDIPSTSNTFGKVGERIFVSFPKKYISSVPKRKQERGFVSKYHGVSPSNTIGRVSKKTLVSCPKTVSISDDVLKLLKAKDGDLMQTTINTIKHSLQSKVSIRLERLSQQKINLRYSDINK